MKLKLLISCLPLLFITIAQAQKKGNAKLYAFMQPVVAGVSPNGEINMDGTTISNQPKTKANYWLYVSYNSSSSVIYPVELWVNGQRYGVNYVTVPKTPVTTTSTDPAANGKELLLVPKTSGKVLMLNMAPQKEKNILKPLSSITKNNAVVLVYKYNGALYYTTLANIKKLDRAYML